MMDNASYLPEGRRIHTPENTAAAQSIQSLTAAMEAGTILEGMALRCDTELNLIVALGGFLAKIPKNETALGIETGKTRDIAILSRVGLPVCFKITEITDGEIRLSRRAAQMSALAYILDSAAPGDVIPATVTHLEPFGAFVDMGCGIPAMISIEKISTARISHPAERFTPGQEIYAVVHEIDRPLSRVNLSHRELLGTWSENAALFRPGETVQGIVSSIKPYGAFVEIAPNLSGLTEPYPGLVQGGRVSVYIKSILPDKQKIKLILINRLPEDAERPRPMTYFIQSGNVLDWDYRAGT